MLHEEVSEYIDSISIENIYEKSNENNQKNKELLNQFRKLFPTLSPLEIRSLLFLIKMDRNNYKKLENKIEIVGTYPSNLDVGLRQTASVVRQLILEAERSILITGYSISEFANEIIELLINKSQNRVSVEF